MHRVETLADHPDGRRPESASPFSSLVPLPEIVSEIERVGPKSKTVQRRVTDLVHRLGPELDILNQLPLEEVAKSGDPLFHEAISRLRRGEVKRQPGFDGEYGVIRLFEPHEVDAQMRIAGFPCPRDRRPQKGKTHSTQTVQETPGKKSLGRPRRRRKEPEQAPPSHPLLAALDPYQRQAAEILQGPLLIVAGPGTGKTRTLTHRLAYLLETGAAEPQHCLALTFTRALPKRCAIVYAISCRRAHSRSRSPPSTAWASTSCAVSTRTWAWTAPSGCSTVKNVSSWPPRLWPSMPAKPDACCGISNPCGVSGR